MLLVRQAGPKDFAGVFSLAKLLDSYNLPADRGYIRQLLQDSQASFARHLPRAKARYLFVLVKRGGEASPIVGCSLIIAKHGVPGRPHLWFSLETLPKYSRTLRLKRSNRVLRLGSTQDGPTEVGGLVVAPGYRKHSQRCGMQISFVRFLYMAIHPERFEDRILVEYRGAMGEGNRSPFWERVGKIFTGLSYKEADRLSIFNKEFILSLMPREPIYCALLPPLVQMAIGAIHPAAQRAARLLQSIGFRPLPQIEPFDGGPYYSARREEIRLVRQTRRLRVGAPFALSLVEARTGQRMLIGTDADGLFRAAWVRGSVVGKEVRMGGKEMEDLNTQVGDTVYVCPLSR